MDFLCSPKQRSCARPPVIPPSSSLPLTGPAAFPATRPQNGCHRSQAASAAGLPAVHGHPHGTEHRQPHSPGTQAPQDRQQQEPTAGRGTNGKICNSTRRWEAKAKPRSNPKPWASRCSCHTSHLQCLSLQSCCLQPLRCPTRPKFSLFSTSVPRNKVSTRNAKDNRSTCLKTEWVHSAASELCTQQPQVETSTQKPGFSLQSWAATRQITSCYREAPGAPRCSSVKIAMARQPVRLHALRTAPLPALLPSQGMFIATEPAPPSDAACL